MIQSKRSFVLTFDDRNFFNSVAISWLQLKVTISGIWRVFTQPIFGTPVLARKESLETVYSSNSRLSLLQKRKKLTPLHLAMSSQTLSSKTTDKYVSQRVLSAKTHRVKQLQNQLADAHYHLQELSNENRVLRALQKKQDIALQRYENSNAELPQVLNSHNEEIRVQQIKYKQLKLQFKDVSQKLKERDLQLQQLKDEHHHLLELSKDRNLPEREKLQAQVSELSLRVQQQNDTISTLQRRIALEAKNFRHQLQNEINKHKDTRHDLDLAITNADKLSTIIEMKEKMLSTVASRGVKSPPKISTSVGNRPISKMTKPVSEHASNVFDERASGDQNIGRYCENSRSLSSALSHDEETSSSLEPKSRYVRNRLNSSSTSKSTPTQTRKSSKGSEDLIEIAKTVQDGMAELSIFNEEIDLNNPSDKESQKKIEMMKQELLKKIKNDEDPAPLKKSSALRRTPTEDAIEETINEVVEIERPKSRGRQTLLYDEISVEEPVTTVALNSHKAGEELKPKRDNSSLQKSTSNKPIDKYCKDIIQDIEKSSKVIDRHIREFSDSKFESDKLVQQLQAVDKINEYVNAKGEIPEEAFEELNNNFKMLTDQVLSESVVPIARKRSISGRRPSRVESRTNLFGDASMSNQDLLEDLLGKK